MAMRTTRTPCDTVYIGGGSPSLLEETELEGIFADLQRHFPIVAAAEVTLEANPEDVSETKLAAWSRLGVNRLSLGVQSFAAADLRYLKRQHDAEQSRRTVRWAVAAGLDNVNLDFIIGLPAQTRRTLANGFDEAARLGATHLSVYVLEGVNRNEERDPDLYHFAREHLLRLGYRHYEVSNFARPGHESRHNLKYWRSSRYIGLGPGAAGFNGRRDLQNLKDVDAWCAALESDRLPLHNATAWSLPLRRIVTGLRLLDGIPARQVEVFPAALAFMLENGLLLRRCRRIAVPAERILLLNEILGHFMT